MAAASAATTSSSCRAFRPTQSWSRRNSSTTRASSGRPSRLPEGLNILRHAGIGAQERAVDAETTPLREPGLYRYAFDLADVAEVWRRGSVVASWLLDLTASALAKSPGLEGFSGRVSDSGEGRWTIAAAVDEGVPAPVLTSALYARFSSRGEADFADRMLSAMRLEFGGHLEKTGDPAS